MAVASSRIQFAVDILDVQSDDQILEIGCGHGVAISLICERLTTGFVSAIDRSPRMVSMAKKRNANWIEDGKAEIVEGSFPNDDLTPSARRYAKLLAINVPLFRSAPVETAIAARQVMVPNGRLYLVSQPPDDTLIAPWVESTLQELVAQQFATQPPVYSDTRPVRTACIVASMSANATNRFRP